MEEVEGQETLGERIRRLRKERRWSLDEMVRQTGLSRTTLAITETNKTSYTKPDTLLKIAQALDVPAYYLETGLWPSGAQAPPPISLEHYLRQTSSLSDEQITVLRRVHEAFQAEGELEGLRDRYMDEPVASYDHNLMDSAEQDSE